MRKKEIEKIPYLGLKKINRKKDVKYIGVTAVKIVGNKKHLFLEVYKNKKESKMVPVVRIILTEKEFWNYFPETEQWTRQKVEKDGGYGNWIWGEKADTWELMEKENVLQSTEDLERIKKFCKIKIPVYYEARWWKYIYRHEDDLAAAAGKKNLRICGQNLFSKGTSSVLQKIWKLDKNRLQQVRWCNGCAVERWHILREPISEAYRRTSRRKKRKMPDVRRGWNVQVPGKNKG